MLLHRLNVIYYCHGIDRVCVWMTIGMSCTRNTQTTNKAQGACGMPARMTDPLARAQAQARIHLEACWSPYYAPTMSPVEDVPQREPERCARCHRPKGSFSCPVHRLEYHRGARRVSPVPYVHHDNEGMRRCGGPASPCTR